MSNSAYVTLKNNLSICTIANENKHYIPETLVTSGTRDTERRKTKKTTQHNTQNTVDLSQVADQFYHMLLYQADIACAGIELTSLVVVGTDFIGSGKSNYNAITTTKTPILLYIAINVLHATAALSLLSITTCNMDLYSIYCNGGVMVSELASSVVDRGFEPRLGQTKHCKIGIC